MRGRRCFMFVMNVDIGIRRIIDLSFSRYFVPEVGRGGGSGVWLVAR